MLVGEAFGRRSPVKTFSRLAYVDVAMEAGASIELPDDIGDRGAYVVEGEVSCGAERVRRWHMLLFRAGHRARVRAETASRFVLLAGDSLSRARHVVELRLQLGGAHRAGEARLARAARRARRPVPARARRRERVHSVARRLKLN